MNFSLGDGIAISIFWILVFEGRAIWDLIEHFAH